MSMRLSIRTLIILAHVCLFITTTTIAQFVLDTVGEPVEGDEEYFIRPVITNKGGRSTMVSRNESCPLHVGLELTGLGRGLVVKFTPFAPHHDFDDVRVNRDLRITFQASSSCVQSTEWRLGEKDTKSGRRLIITGTDSATNGSYGNFFRIVETPLEGMYNIQWCPTEVCPSCKFECGTVDMLNENGKILLALDGGPLPLVFQKE
ncbi:putative proteinase inhibitor I3, Kunitz legume [Medicago truncatula]|uniref:Kunitz type trypsin inhibitor 106 n=1 Tax=Medicago truncatula TaxID=3880 RepID=KI106_MEDTR|nr:kunitz type trypsin inhibitor 106 precursor [Medicago truncatula]G7LCV1.1 RecName: Full=Kunitz type trypsin inhibitor 106; Flags: Precursor [Medicago truncatula]AET02976.1 Kunitz type trypsin inhibitor [Medicago truncatula]RHN40828.1 putative proteinase inhibitor I3, Kunitz legume [Medicago truncatula]